MGSGSLKFSIGALFALTAITYAADMIGIISDDIIKPQRLNSFNPPKGAGSTYTDPAFGTRITRLTDNTAFNRFVLGGYMGNSEICYFNRDGSCFLAAENDAASGKITTFLYDGRSGQRIRALGRFEPYVLRWPLADRYKKNGQVFTFDPLTHFYKYDGNELQLWDVNDPGAYEIIREFTEYDFIGPAGGEGDISHDGRFWVLDGDAKELFVYDLIDDVKFAVSTFDIGSLGSKGSDVGVDYAAISPRGDFIILSWGTDPGAGRRHAGIELYDRNWTFLRQLHPSIVHWASGIDAFGEQVIYTVVTHDFPEVFAACGATPGDIISVQLSDGSPRLLKDIPLWAHMAISACNSVTDGDYIHVSYHNRSNDPNALWSPFWDEIIEVPTDGSQQVRRFLHHHSHYVTGQSTKYYQPDAVVNRQGDKLIYRSTYNTGIGDLYMFDIGDRGVDPSDSTAPNSPLNLRQGVTTHDAIELSWDEPPAAADGDVPSHYRVYRDGLFVSTVYGLVFTDQGLREARAYEYKIVAVDDAGNESAGFLSAVFSTLADVEPPRLLAARVQDKEHVELYFSEALERSSAESAANYVIDQGIAVRSATYDNLRTVVLQTSALQLGNVYTVTVNGVTDGSSQRNRISPNSAQLFSLVAGFYDDFENGLSPSWELRTPSRWSLDEQAGNSRLFLHTTDYGDYSTKMAGEYAILRDSHLWGGEFRILCEAKSNEDLLANTAADYAVFFGFADDLNYYYVQWQPENVKLHRIVDGERTLFVEHYHKSDFERFLSLSVELTQDILRVSVDGKQVFTHDLSDLAPISGKLGIGSYNDSAWFDNVNVGPYDQGDNTPPAAPSGLVIVTDEKM
ncbi:Ig-like domain-containing protein [candidate division KSB1 bacterium]|nr:Ig-like domain-containing protein [candidate division KSB1 bacterium]